MSDYVVEEGDGFVRPYLITAGRTKSAVEGLNLETMVERTGGPIGPLRFEASQIASMCREPISIAELSAHLSIPFGVVRVVVGDLIQSGHVRTHRTIDGNATGDVEIINRLINGVRRL